MPNDEYIKLFNSYVTVLETLGGQLHIHLKLVHAKLALMRHKGQDIENPKPHLYKKVILRAHNEYLALLALSGPNGMKFSGLKDKLENKSLFGHDNNPEDQT